MSYQKGAKSMATVNQEIGNRSIAGSIQSKYFTPSEQQRMIDEDLSAGRTVSLELIAIVTMGLLLGALAVLLTI